jgi:hypothetical protein
VPSRCHFRDNVSQGERGRCEREAYSARPRVKNFTLIAARRSGRIAPMRNFLKWLKQWLMPQVPRATVYKLSDFSRAELRERRTKSL